MLKLLHGGKSSPVKSQTRKAFPLRAEVADRLFLARSLNEYDLDDVHRVTGLSVSWLRMLEAGLAEPSSEDLEKLSTAYRATVQWLRGVSPQQADESVLAAYANVMTQESRFRVLTILAMSPEWLTEEQVRCG